MKRPLGAAKSVKVASRISTQLPAKDMAQVRSIAAATKVGAGARPKALLFSGKNAGAAAQAMANELRRDLYRVDLSAIVSKYVGETEKNLARVFAEAEGADAILQFDEADALLGQRSEVKDAHDRYSNLEVGYLLQRIEQHDGLIVLVSKSKPTLSVKLQRRFSVYGFPP